ncbi:hypothetical protein ACWDV4_12105 [Micromonospora sp. NPDC003197]
MVQPYLQQGLRLHPAHVQADLAERCVDANVEPNQVEHLGMERNPQPDVAPLQVERVYVEDRYVQQHVLPSRRLVAGGLPGVLTLRCGVGSHGFQDSSSAPPVWPVPALRLAELVRIFDGRLHPVLATIDR